MPRFQTLVSYLLLVIHTLLVFLLIFQEKVTIPNWLQPLGRMHPAILHLPIGLLILVGLLWVFRKEFEGMQFAKIFGFILSFSAFTAALAALMGFFLSREEGYTAELLNWHKYTGIGLSFLMYGLVLLHQQYIYRKVLFNVFLGGSLIVLMVTGHFGASLTHGEDYLFPSKNQENAPLTFDENKPIFEAAIQPILKAKCYQCHNEQKTKGELLMTTIAGLLKGGKNGPIWVANDALNSHIIQRANLPLDDKKHMPPKGKPQLTPQEVGIITAWIQNGADVKKSLKALAANDPLKSLIEAFLKKPSNAPSPQQYTFDAASESTIQKLNNPFRVIFPIANNSPALQADFFVRQAYKAEQLGELSEIKTQLVALNLSNMPIKDDDLATISKLENLERLNLNNTDISGASLSKLEGLSKLKSLSLSGTKVSAKALQFLSKLPQLEEVFIWNTQVSETDLASLQKQIPKLRFELGYVPKASEILKLNAPILVNENFVLSETDLVTFKHPLNGVTIRYTIDGSNPDTLSSPIFTTPFKLTNPYTVVKARAMKDNWYASDVIEIPFFKGTYRPSSVELLKEPNPTYKGEDSHTLINRKKGDPNDFKNPAWLGYRESPLEALFTFAQPTPVKRVTLSLGNNIGSSIFPPTSVEIWAGPDKNNLSLVQKIQPAAPQKVEAARIQAIESQLKEGNYGAIKIIARPIGKLPEWHSGKGQPGWVFVDEVFFN